MDLGHGSTWALLYLLSEWAIRIGMLVVVPVRRSPEAAKGWLLLAFFLPWPALALYAHHRPADVPPLAPRAGRPLSVRIRAKLNGRG